MVTVRVPSSPWFPNNGRCIEYDIEPRHGLYGHPLNGETWAILEPLIRENHTAAGIDAALRLDFRKLEACNPRVWILWHEGQAVGYCAHIVAPHLFTGELTATCAAIYVRPDHRAKVRRMIADIELDLCEDGVAGINYSVPHLSKAGAFFEHVGYGCTELVMSKRLEPSQ